MQEVISRGEGPAQEYHLPKARRSKGQRCPYGALCARTRPSQGQCLVAEGLMSGEGCSGSSLGKREQACSYTWPPNPVGLESP